MRSHLRNLQRMEDATVVALVDPDQEHLASVTKQFPELAAEFDLMQKSDLPQGWDADIPTFEADAKGMASRVSSGKVLNQIAKNVPWLLGGSADLAASTKT